MRRLQRGRTTFSPRLSVVVPAADTNLYPQGSQNRDRFRFSAGEIAKHFGVSLHDLEIIGESGEHILRATADYSLHAKHGLEEDAYFLAASNWAPSKGISKAFFGLSPASHTWNHKFVIVDTRSTPDLRFSRFRHRRAVEVALRHRRPLPRALQNGPRASSIPPFTRGSACRRSRPCAADAPS